MKLLYLIIYNPDSHYEREMFYQLQRYTSVPYIETFTTTYFITSCSSQIENVREVKNVLYVKGEESYIPGILNKCLAALNYLIYEKKLSFTYLIRGNISTIIDLYKVYKLLLHHNISYGGFRSFTLSWTFPFAGVVDETYFGLKFISGTSILISYNMATEMIQNLNRHNLADDLEIALFFQERNIEPVVFDNQFVTNCNDNYYRYMVFRNKTDDREEDAKNMSRIVSFLINNTFDWKFYISHHKDLCKKLKKTREAALCHFILYGLKEGRICNIYEA
jgi:hypothetical protein